MKLAKILKTIKTKGLLLTLTEKEKQALETNGATVTPCEMPCGASEGCYQIEKQKDA